MSTVRLWATGLFIALALLACSDDGADEERDAASDSSTDARSGDDGGSDPKAGDNRPPTANAGADEEVEVGAEVALDGSGSTDPDGDELTYRWSRIARPTDSEADPADPTAANTSFVVDQSGTYVFELVVRDDSLSSEPDRVMFSTSDNLAPVAEAGPAQAVKVGDTVTLDGSGSSDVDGDPLTFSWSLTSQLRLISTAVTSMMT